MSNFLKRLTNSYHPEPERVEPRYSRKNQRVTVTVCVYEFPIDASVSIWDLDEAIDRICKFARGTGPVQILLDELLIARHQFGHKIDGKKKNRGRQSKRGSILYDLQYASAWSYCFIRHHRELPQKIRNPLLRKFEARLGRRLRKEKMLNDWKNAKRSWQIRLFTAFVVGSAYARKRDQHGLSDPVAEFAKFHADSFYRTYVQPKLKHVESRVQKRPKLLDSLSNAYLRNVFYPRTSKAPFSAS
jgi:hypothetical protein